MEIIPDDKSLLVETTIKAEDIAYVQNGMRAELRVTFLMTLPFRKSRIVW